MLSKSHLTKQTKVVIRMLEMCGNKESAVYCKLSEIRAKTVKQLAEQAVLGTKQIIPLFKPLLDSVILIYQEF